MLFAGPGLVLMLLGLGLSHVGLFVFGSFLTVVGIMIWLYLPHLSDVYEHGWPADPAEVVKYPPDDDSEEEE